MGIAENRLLGCDGGHGCGLLVVGDGGVVVKWRSSQRGAKGWCWCLPWVETKVRRWRGDGEGVSNRRGGEGV